MPLQGEYAPSTSAWAREQAERYEASGGTEAATLQGRPIIVLTSLGARTGLLRKTALMRVEHDGEYAVVASKGGAPEHPVWYHNLKAHPLVELQDGPTRRDYTVRELSGDEREAWWRRAVEVWPPYDGVPGEDRAAHPGAAADARRGLRPSRDTPERVRETSTSRDARACRGRRGRPDGVLTGRWDERARGRVRAGPYRTPPQPHPTCS